MPEQRQRKCIYGGEQKGQMRDAMQGAGRGGSTLAR